MPEITFVDYAGDRRTISAEAGLSLMEVARMNDIPGIDAECGGVCACATCHVFIDPTFRGKLNMLTDCEIPMLEFVDYATQDSRLSCQVIVTDSLDGLIVHTPESQR
jgi:2Fe-2S ferredoxin